MKRIWFILLICSLVLSACGKGQSEVKVTSFDIVSITPQGLTNLDALAAVGVDNPKIGFEISDVNGIVKMHGSPCIVITADRIVIDGHSNKLYKIPFSGALAEEFNPFILLNFLKDKKIDAFTVDLKLKVSMRGGVGKVIELKDLPLEQLAHIK